MIMQSALSKNIESHFTIGGFNYCVFIYVKNIHCLVGAGIGSKVLITIVIPEMNYRYNYIQIFLLNVCTKL